MPPVSFEQIPASTRVPGVLTEVSSQKAIGGPLIKPWAVLMIGQRLSTGTVAQKVKKSAQNDDQVRGWFGPGSMLHGMAKRYFQNPHVQDVDVIALDDAGGATAATLASTVTATSAGAGTIALYVAGYRAAIAVSAGMAASAIATAIAAAVNAIDSCPVSAGAAGAVVTFTARNKGVVGNELDVRVSYYDDESLPSGVTLSNVPGTLTGGATNPTIDSTLWSVLGDKQYDLIVAPYSDSANVAAIDAECLDRWSPGRQIEASAVMAKNDTVANLATFGAAKNSLFICVAVMTRMVSAPWEVAAALGAIRSFYARNDPAQPQRSIVLRGILAPATENRHGYADREVLLRSGCSPFVVVGGAVQVDRTITTYQKSASGAADESFLDTTTVDTASYVRWSFRQRMLSRFPRHKLVGDDVRPASGQAVITPRIATAEVMALFDEWLELVLVEDREQFKRDLRVERNASDPTRLDFLLPPNFANPFYLAAAQLQFRL